MGDNTVTSDLTIVIPAKNEESRIGALLNSIAHQSYLTISITKIYLADAGSTDDTVKFAQREARRLGLDLEIITGGLPAVGRNNGAGVAKTDYIVFLDADVVINDYFLLEKSLQMMRDHELDLVTTDIFCPDGRTIDKLFYWLSNTCQYWSPFFHVPFATGMYMFWRRQAFHFRGPFDEKALYAEDYMLSKRVHPQRYGIVKGGVNTSNRRFLKMGLWKSFWLFAKTIVFGNNDAYFRKDQSYWKYY